MSASSKAPAIRRRPARRAVGAVPEPPSLLFHAAAAMPATGVPWVSASLVGLGSVATPSFQLWLLAAS